VEGKLHTLLEVVGQLHALAALTLVCERLSHAGRSGEKCNVFAGSVITKPVASLLFHSVSAATALIDISKCLTL
jgi:hypothetical protein